MSPGLRTGSFRFSLYTVTKLQITTLNCNYYFFGGNPTFHRRRATWPMETEHRYHKPITEVLTGTFGIGNLVRIIQGMETSGSSLVSNPDPFIPDGREQLYWLKLAYSRVKVIQSLRLSNQCLCTVEHYKDLSITLDLKHN